MRSYFRRVLIMTGLFALLIGAIIASSLKHANPPPYGWPLTIAGAIMMVLGFGAIIFVGTMLEEGVKRLWRKAKKSN
jgi:ABC-type branched-subunit amino acid transport system permease subunit